MIFSVQDFKIDNQQQDIIHICFDLYDSLISVACSCLAGFTVCDPFIVFHIILSIWERVDWPWPQEELKHNFCWVSVELEPRYAYMMGKGKGWGKDGSNGEDKDSPAIIEKVVSIITVRNSRDALGEKGARIRLLQHKARRKMLMKFVRGHGFRDHFCWTIANP